MALLLEIVTEAHLHAYVDGELDAEERAAVEEILADDAGAAQRVRAYERQIACLHRLFGAGPEEPMPRGRPAALRAAASAGPAAPARTPPRGRS